MNEADEKLVNQIAEEGVKLYNFPNLWKRLTDKEKDNWRNWARTIRGLFIEAGWIDPSSLKC